MTGQSHYITDIMVSNSTLATAGEFVVRSGAGGTVLWRIAFPTGAFTGVAFHFKTPLVGAVGALLEICTPVAIATGNIYCNVQGYSA